MTQQPLSKQAKNLMDAAEALEREVAVKYGMNSSAGLSAFQCVGHQFYLYCELERMENEAIDRM